jgi:lipoate-protein ligase A
MNSVRLIPFEISDGPANMAADEVMLDRAVAGFASLRFYGWTAPTLSLGYFQPEAVRHTDPRLAKLPYVRRASGGAALVHDRELTYALALPAGFGWQPKGQSWICRMHAIIAVALKSFNVTAEPLACDNEKKLGEVLCFLHQTAGDLIVGGHKIVGSAQRKQRGATLQHGAILLAQSPHAPSVSGLQEIHGNAPSRIDLINAIQREFCHQTKWDLRDGEWTVAERSLIRDRVDQRYATADWNNKR